MKCNNCKNLLGPQDKFCGNCGFKVEVVNKCNSCGKCNAPETKFCGECGNNLQASNKAVEFADTANRNTSKSGSVVNSQSKENDRNKLQKFNNDTLRAAVKEWLEDPRTAEENYGHISNWDVSNVTDMSGLFQGADDFNEPIGNWDVSNVSNMMEMFLDASSFNQPLEKWCVSRVSDMSWMFSGASVFNQPVNNWDVSLVTDMRFMFSETHSFNQPLNNWDVKNVVEMKGMFNGAYSFNQPIGMWNVSQVINMEAMFGGAKAFDQSLDNWKISDRTKLGFKIEKGITSQVNNNNSLNLDELELKKEFYDSGELKREYLLNSSGGIEGTVVCYHKNGNVRVKLNYLNGIQQDGYIVSYDEDGNIESESNNREQFLTDSVTYHPNGAVKEIFEYFEVSRTEFNSDGEFLSYTEYPLFDEKFKIEESTKDIDWLPSGFLRTGIEGLGVKYLYVEKNQLGNDTWEHIMISVYTLHAVRKIIDKLIFDCGGRNNFVELSEEVLKKEKSVIGYQSVAISIIVRQHEGRFYICVYNKDEFTFLSINEVNKGISEKSDFINEMIPGLCSLVYEKGSMYPDGRFFILDQKTISSWSEDFDELLEFFYRINSVYENLNKEDIEWIENPSIIKSKLKLKQSTLNNSYKFFDVNLFYGDHVFHLDIKFKESFSDWNSDMIKSKSWRGENDLDTPLPVLLTMAFSRLKKHFPISALALIEKAEKKHYQNFNDNLNCKGYSMLANSANNYSILKILQLLDIGERSTAERYMERVIFKNDSKLYPLIGDFLKDRNNENRSKINDQVFKALGINNQGLEIMPTNETEDIKKNVTAKIQGENKQQKLNNYSLRVAVKEWLENPEAAEKKHGHISKWDTSGVTDMSELFMGATDFNDNIGKWDVSKIMEVFGNVVSFNQPIGNWDVSNVKNMSGMFRGISDFNQPLNNWDVSKVTDMSGMFLGVRNFNQPLNNWNVSKVTDMWGMFRGADNFAHSIAEWTLSEEISKENIFSRETDRNKDFAQIFDECNYEKAHRYNNKAFDCFSKGEINEGIMLVEKALEILPETPSFIDTLAFGYYLVEDYDEAIRFSDICIELDENGGTIKADHYVTRGKIHLKLGNRDQAIKDFKKALEIDPNYKEAKDLLGR